MGGALLTGAPFFSRSYTAKRGFNSRWARDHLFDLTELPPKAVDGKSGSTGVCHTPSASRQLRAQTYGQVAEKIRLPTNMRVHFAIPCYGRQITSATFSSFVHLTWQCAKRDLKFTLDTYSDSLVTRTRNILVANMMHDPQATHLMFIDADIGFDAKDVFKLLDHDLDVCGALYPRKSLPIKYVVNQVPNPEKKGSCIEVRHLGTGFMLIKRNVFEQLFKIMPHLKVRVEEGDKNPVDDSYYALFDTALDANGYYLSEDWTFCDLVRDKLGLKIWADISIKLDHRGNYNYSGDLDLLRKEFAEAGA